MSQRGGDEIAILGLPSSGKTTYIAAMVRLLENDPSFGLHVDYGDDAASRIYVQDRISEMETRGAFEATQPGKVTNVSFQIVGKRGRVTVRTKEVSGEEIERLFKDHYRKFHEQMLRARQGASQGGRLVESEFFQKLNDAQKSLAAQIESSTRFLLLIDPTHDSGVRKRQHTFVSSLLQILKVIHGNEHLDEVAIALLFTKADMYPEVNRPAMFLFKRYPEFALDLLRSFPIVAIYPVSAAGGYRWTTEKGARQTRFRIGLKPKNVIEPLFWLMQPKRGQIEYYRSTSSGERMKRQKVRSMYQCLTEPFDDEEEDDLLPI
ncbi:MAG: hypothetical protein ACTSVT_09395 [Candidatus Thorarchaeota archaeon]